MIRKIVSIDEETCNGCGLCASACHEGAIEMVNGKARLIKDDYCDGLGDCLPHCPTGAIRITSREAAAYDEAAVKARLGGEVSSRQRTEGEEHPHHGGCPGSMARQLHPGEIPEAADATAQDRSCAPASSQLRQWPVQIKLVPVRAPFYDKAKLLIAADCTAYAYARFHEDFIKDHVVLVGCPKLDDVDYSEKLTQIIAENEIRSVTILRMEVPCCGGLEHMARQALRQSGKFIPWQVVTISIEGDILDR